MQLSSLRYYISLNFLKLQSKNSPKSLAMIIHHGMLGSGRNYKPLFTNSSLLNYLDILLPDARNHGLSPHTNSHSIQDLADDLNQFIINQSQHYQQFILLGHSMGGLAVMDFTKQYLATQKFIKTVIIVDIFCHPKQLTKRRWNQQAQLKMLLDASNINLNQSTKSLFQQINSIALDTNYADLLKFNIQVLGNQTHKWKANLPIIAKYYKTMLSYTLSHCHWKKPVDIIYGTQSQYFEQPQLKYFIHHYPQITPSKNIHRIQGAGHWIHLTKKLQYLNILQQIIKNNTQ